MQFQVKHEPPMTRGLMEHISSVNFLQHKGGNCLDIGLSLGTDCPQEKERYTIGYDRGDKDYVEVADKVIKQEDGLRSAMKRKTAVSFLDWGNKDEYRVSELKNGDKDRDLERVGSGMSTLSGCGGDSDASGDEPRRASSLQYKGGAPWEVQRIWMGAFNNQADVAVPMFRGQNAMKEFKPTEQDQIDRATVGIEEDNNKKGKPSQGQGQGVEQNGREDDEKKLSREHMFDKAVTPSDVGKLNRLVIPKQHAEKFFPLDTNANEKGLLLNFEDNVGKAWRFRYSYWNSSQSYVLTKGWSRFVKEKKLYAGDIVSFERGTHQNVHRLFISWRRRPCVPVMQPCFTDPSKTLIPALPCLTRPNIQYRPFQSHGVNISTAAAAVVGRQPQFQGTVIPACSKVFPQWMSLVWPGNGGGTSSRAAAFSLGSQMWAPVAEPQQMDGYFHANSKTADLQDTDRVPLDFMQLGAPEKSQGDVLWPMETKPGTGFDPSTSKKGVRLFGVNL